MINWLQASPLMFFKGECTQSDNPKHYSNKSLSKDLQFLSQNGVL